MSIDRNALLALWDLENKAVAKASTLWAARSPPIRITEMTASYTAMVEHDADCDDCNEVNLHQTSIEIGGSNVQTIH
jgi:hypothetical protein